MASEVLAEATATKEHDALSGGRPAARPWLVRQWPGMLTVLLIGFGVVVRARQFGARRSLWLDESMITDNLMGRTWAGLTRPLAHHQGAPLGWLMAEKLSLHIFGANEYALRLPAFCAGVLTLPVMLVLARRMLPRALVPVVVGATAVSPQLIRYSSEVKQYGSDALAVLLAVTVAVLIAQRPAARIGWREAAGWAVTGGAAVMLSHPGILATGACCIVLTAGLLRRRLEAGLWLAGASLLITGVLLTDYLVSLRALGQDQALKAYWKDTNPPRPMNLSSLLRWMGVPAPRSCATRSISAPDSWSPRCSYSERSGWSAVGAGS